MLSREFLIERGYCCGHGCLMCPYEPKHTEGATTMKNEITNELKIAVLEKKVARLEKTLKEFMDNWGPDVQKKRDERDERWDEMIRVLTVQERKKAKKSENN